MLQPIFYFDKLDFWDRISIPFYIVVTAICAYFFMYNNSPSENRTLLLFYTLGTQLLLYLLNYKSLRNLTVYIVWIVIASAHLLFYFHLKDNPELQNVHSHAATGLRNTIILLLLYQILRVISLNTQRQELVAPTRGGTTDIFEDRKLTFIDYVLFVVYFATTIILNV
jgi:hypothetical protein